MERGDICGLTLVRLKELAVILASKHMTDVKNYAAPDAGWLAYIPSFVSFVLPVRFLLPRGGSASHHLDILAVI